MPSLWSLLGCWCCDEDSEKESSKKLVSNLTDWRKHPLIGQYELLKVVGEGGFSEVWLAKNKETGQKAAIKAVYLSKPGIKPSEVKILESEAKFLRMLDHPSLIHCFHVLETRFDLVMVLEYLDGGELLDHLHTIHHFDENQAALLFRQIVEAVAYLHDLNILHRDIKPENVLFTHPVKWFQEHKRPLQVKLIDLGMAGVYDERKNKLRGVFGSPGFMAPEVIKGDYHTPAMDIYALGAMLFVLLTGRKPHDLKSTRNLEYAFKPIKEAAGMKDARFLAASQPAQELVLWMMADKPQDRPTARQVLSHAWVRSLGAGSRRPIIDDVVRRRMAQLSSLRRFKGMAFALMGASDYSSQGGTPWSSSFTSKTRPPGLLSPAVAPGTPKAGSGTSHGSGHPHSNLSRVSIGSRGHREAVLRAIQLQRKLAYQEMRGRERARHMAQRELQAAEERRQQERLHGASSAGAAGSSAGGALSAGGATGAARDQRPSLESVASGSTGLTSCTGTTATATGTAPSSRRTTFEIERGGLGAAHPSSPSRHAIRAAAAAGAAAAGAAGAAAGATACLSVNGAGGSPGGTHGGAGPQSWNMSSASSVNSDHPLLAQAELSHQATPDHHQLHFHAPHHPHHHTYHLAPGSITPAGSLGLPPLDEDSQGLFPTPPPSNNQADGGAGLPGVQKANGNHAGASNTSSLQGDAATKAAVVEAQGKATTQPAAERGRAGGVSPEQGQGTGAHGEGSSHHGKHRHRSKHRHAHKGHTHSMIDVEMIAAAMQAAPGLQRSWSMPEAGRLPNVVGNAMGAPGPKPLMDPMMGTSVGSQSPTDMEQVVARTLGLVRAMSLNPLGMAFLAEEQRLQELLGGDAFDALRLVGGMGPADSTGSRLSLSGMGSLHPQFSQSPSQALLQLVRAASHQSAQLAAHGSNPNMVAATGGSGGKAVQHSQPVAIQSARRQWSSSSRGLGSSWSLTPDGAGWSLAAGAGPDSLSNRPLLASHQAYGTPPTSVGGGLFGSPMQGLSPALGGFLLQQQLSPLGTPPRSSARGGMAERESAGGAQAGAGKGAGAATTGASPAMESDGTPSPGVGPAGPAGLPPASGLRPKGLVPPPTSSWFASPFAQAADGRLGPSSRRSSRDFSAHGGSYGGVSAQMTPASLAAVGQALLGPEGALALARASSCKSNNEPLFEVGSGGLSRAGGGGGGGTSSAGGTGAPGSAVGSALNLKGAGSSNLDLDMMFKMSMTAAQRPRLSSGQLGLLVPPPPDRSAGPSSLVALGGLEAAVRQGSEGYPEPQPSGHSWEAQLGYGGGRSAGGPGQGGRHTMPSALPTVLERKSEMQHDMCPPSVESSRFVI